MSQTKAEIQAEYQIIQEAKKNPKAFGVIYERYYPAIFRYVDKRVNEPETTADLVSQVFLKALTKLNQYQYRGVPFSAFLYRIATNQVNEFFRNSSRIRSISVEEHHLPAFFQELDLEVEDVEEIVGRVFSSLDPQEVNMLELRFFEGKPFKEIAFILSITENNAKVKMYRLLDKIKKMLTEDQRP